MPYPAPHVTVTWSTLVVAPRSTCHCCGLLVPLCQTVPAAQSSALPAVPEFEDALAGRPQARSVALGLALADEPIVTSAAAAASASASARWE